VVINHIRGAGRGADADAKADGSTLPLCTHFEAVAGPSRTSSRFTATEYRWAAATHALHQRAQTQPQPQSIRRRPRPRPCCQLGRQKIDDRHRRRPHGVHNDRHPKARQWLVLQLTLDRHFASQADDAVHRGGRSSRRAAAATDPRPSTTSSYRCQYVRSIFVTQSQGSSRLAPRARGGARGASTATPVALLRSSPEGGDSSSVD